MQIQLDTGKQVAKNNLPVQQILAIGWIEIAGYYFESFLPYIPMSTERQRTYIVIGKHVLIQALNFVAMNIRLAYNISGMLASSFQPDDI